MTTNLERIARSVIEAAEKATKSPWSVNRGNWQIEQKDTRDGVCTFFPANRDGIDGTTNPIDPFNDAEFIVEATNHAKNLARACLAMREALIKGTDGGSVFWREDALFKAEEIMRAIDNESI